MFKIVIGVTAVLMVALVESKLPSKITACRRHDPQLNDCIIKQLDNLRPNLANGDFGEGYNVPALEPLLLSNVAIARRQLNAVFSNIEARGGSNFTIDRLKADADRIAFDVDLTLPKIEFTGTYKMNINIFVFQSSGEGKMEGTFENAKAFVRMRGIRHLQDGIEYVKMTDMGIHIQPDFVRFHLSNLFNNRAIGNMGNMLLNEHKDMYLREIIPGLQNSLSDTFLQMANNILNKTTYDEMFPV